MIITEGTKIYYEFSFDIPDGTEENTEDGNTFQLTCLGMAEDACNSLNDSADLLPNEGQYYRIVFTNKTAWLLWEVGKLIIRVFVPYGLFIPLP